MEKRAEQSLLYLGALCSAFISFFCLCTRSVHRPKDHTKPIIVTRWKGDIQSYALSYYHLEYYPFFQTFNKPYFDTHQLPHDEIYFRYNPDKHVLGSNLRALIENLLQELKAGKTEFTDFDVLRATNYNKKYQSGLIILAFKNYPFVVKVFIETPASFLKSHAKGIAIKSNL